MAIRILLVLAVLAIFYGCGNSSSPPEQNEKEGGTQPQSVSASGSGQQVASATASGSAQLLTNAIPSGSAQRVKRTTPLRPGQQLAFSRRVAGRDVLLYAMDPADAKPTRLTKGVSPAWSPDGKQIAYTKYLKEPNPYASSAPASVDALPFRELPYIFVMNADGSGGKQLLDRPSLLPEWSPDGKKIAFTLEIPGKVSISRASASCGIYIMNTDGTGTPRKLATGPGCASSPGWSPDGKEIAYTYERNRRSGYQDIYVTDASSQEGHTNQPRALTDYALGTAYDPSWSPDGAEIAFTLEDSEDKTGIYRMDSDGASVTPLARPQHVKKLEETSDGWPVLDRKGSPVWSPDGEQIAYVRSVPVRDPSSMGVGGYSLFPSAIYIMNSDGSNPILVKDFGKGNEIWGLDWRALP